MWSGRLSGNWSSQMCMRPFDELCRPVCKFIKNSLQSHHYSYQCGTGDSAWQNFDLVELHPWLDKV